MGDAAGSQELYAVAAAIGGRRVAAAQIALPLALHTPLQHGRGAPASRGIVGRDATSVLKRDDSLCVATNGRLIAVRKWHAHAACGCAHKQKHTCLRRVVSVGQRYPLMITVC